MNPRIIEKTTIINDPLSATTQSSKPFIVRIPHIQTKSPLHPESGKVVIVKTTPTLNQSTTLTSTLPQQQQPTKSFSVVKLADGQILLVPTNIQPQQQLIVNENGISRIIKASSTSPPNPTGTISTIKRITKEQNTSRVSTIQITNLTSPSTNIKCSQQQQQSISPQERRLRPIAPAPTSLSSTTNDLLNSILAQQQQQLNASSPEMLLRFDPTASVLLAGEDDSLPIISETVTLDSNGSSLKINNNNNNNKRKIESSLPIERQTSLPVVSSPTIQQKPKHVRKTITNDEKPTTKARLENKATSIIKDSGKKMTPRQVSIPQTSTIETKTQKTPIKRLATTTLPPKIDPEEGIRMKICETILRSLIGRIEREQNQESIKTRLEKHSTTIPKLEHRQIILTRLLNERVDILRQEFIKNRSERKTALVKEQFQIQRLKQQQQIILKQQQQATNIKQDQFISDDDNTNTTTNNKDDSPPAKKTKKIYGNETKHKRQATPKSSEQNIKSTTSKRTRPMASTKLTDDDQSPPSKKVRRPRSNNVHDLSDNDENFLTNRKSSSTISKIKPKLITTINASIQRKSHKLSSDFKPENIDCNCKRNNDIQEKFFIQCELCSRWLHGKCVGLTPRLAEKMNEFICEDCAILTQRAKERLYCICQTPYDESKFYIGCDVCADWLHGSCVNITPEDAEKFEVYVCPRCSTEKKQEFLNKPIVGETRKKLINLIDQLLAHKMSWPFQKPVDVKDVPNYYKIIKDPMDLTTLKTKVLNNKFRTICDFIRDVNKIFNNCRQFNPIDSAFSQCANVVDNCFRQLLENLMTKDQNL
ncbi:unnamed protein product [Rotaria sp. Silwood2]|nr:unnamed protein product [Rotaria sp. Silwood2]CAF3025033.1 unnamed protein product [Rotaria sp. Silwood2]CAF4253706.1 unnamed protein product [Rotaria sp. Silwood2]